MPVPRFAPARVTKKNKRFANLMSSKPTPAAKMPEIQKLHLKSLVVDTALSGRSESEIKQNAKTLAPLIQAKGEWDISQPGQFFMRGGKPHLLVGFTRTQACNDLGIKEGYFVEVPDDPAANRTACIRTNAGKGISAIQQGRLFLAMAEGTDPATLKKGEVAMAPMKHEDIAREVGLSQAWVGRCIIIASSPKDISAMVECDPPQVSPNIVPLAKTLAKDDEAKWRKILNAAIAEAKRDGKETATKKHFDAIKGEFAPKLKADTSAPSKEEKKEEKKEAKSEREEKEEPKEAKTEKEKAAPAQSAMDLGSTSESKDDEDEDEEITEPIPAKPSKKDKTSTINFLTECIIAGDSNLKEPTTIDEKDARGIATFLYAAGIGILPESPI